MSERYSTVCKAMFLGVSAVALIFGALGILDIGNVPYAGYFTGPDNSVARVFPGSPAEAAGLEVGDVVRSIDGISINDTKALTRRPRAAIGETRTLSVERDGMPMDIDVEFAALPSINRTLGFAAALIGVCYLAFGLWPFFRVPGPATTLLALFGLCFGIAFLPGPYSPSVLLRTLGGAVATLVVVLGFAYLVHFLLAFPKRRAFLDRPASTKIIYGPAVLIALFLLFLILFRPDGTGTLNSITSILVGLFVVGYFGWAMVAIIQSFVRASADERTEHGLNLMLVGTIVGLVPVTISSLVGTVAPTVGAALPGVQFYFLTLVLIPLSFAVATVRSATAV